MVGIDLVYIPEFQSRLNAGGNALLEKMFTIEELKNRRVEHLAGIWAAKESVRKTLQDAPKAWTDIFLTYDNNGKPTAHYNGVLYAISISHQQDYAVAVAVIEPLGKEL